MYTCKYIDEIKSHAEDRSVDRSCMQVPEEPTGEVVKGASQGQKA